jgi:hypothetical protein
LIAGDGRNVTKLRNESALARAQGRCDASPPTPNDAGQGWIGASAAKLIWRSARCARRHDAALIRHLGVICQLDLSNSLVRSSAALRAGSVLQRAFRTASGDIRSVVEPAFGGTSHSSTGRTFWDTVRHSAPTEQIFDSGPPAHRCPWAW